MFQCVIFQIKLHYFQNVFLKQSNLFFQHSFLHMARDRIQFEFDIIGPRSIENSLLFVIEILVSYKVGSNCQQLIALWKVSLKSKSAQQHIDISCNHELIRILSYWILFADMYNIKALEFYLNVVSSLKFCKSYLKLQERQKIYL